MIKCIIRKEHILGNNLSLYFLKDTSRHRACVTRIEWTEFEDDGQGIQSEPLSLQTSEAQNLIDALWDAGLRPSEGSGSAGAMAATQKHLEDMRTLVFKKQ